MYGQKAQYQKGIMHLRFGENAGKAPGQLGRRASWMPDSEGVGVGFRASGAEAEGFYLVDEAVVACVLIDDPSRRKSTASGGMPGVHVGHFVDSN